MINGVQVHGSSTRNTLSKNDEILERERLRHNKEMRVKHLHNMQFNDLPSYKRYLLGKKQVQPSKSTYSWGKTSYRRGSNSETVKSLNSNQHVSTAPIKQEYTGDLVKGISTLHKSNAVPVIDAEYAKEIARMRRG